MYFETRSDIAGSLPNLETAFVARYASGHPLGVAPYIPNGSPAGPGAIQDAGGRWWNLDLSGGHANLRWFGANNYDPANDSTAAMQAAVAALSPLGAKSLFCPAGPHPYRFNQTIMPGAITFVGEGLGNESLFQGVPAVVGTKFLWTGDNQSACFKFAQVPGGGMKDCWLDASGAWAAVFLDSCWYMRFERFSAINCGAFGLLMDGSTSACGWNEFSQTHWESTITNGNSLVWLTGTPTGGNACHNTFHNTRVHHRGSTHGIVHAGCDNNNFSGVTYVWSPPGTTGSAVRAKKTILAGGYAFPLGETYEHLEAMSGVSVDAGVPSPALTINLYARDNGEPDPTGPGVAWMDVTGAWH
jgi:hypothetical protein